MSGFEFHRVPHDAKRVTAPCDAVATALFDVADPVLLDTQQLRQSVDDGGLVEDAECIGFACEPAEGITAASRTTNAADGFGVVENQERTYFYFNTPGLQLRTRNFYATGDPTTLAEPDANNIGVLYGMSAVAASGVFGVEETAGTVGTDATVLVENVLDANMRPITESGGTGVWVVFSGCADTTQDRVGG